MSKRWTDSYPIGTKVQYRGKPGVVVATIWARTEIDIVIGFDLFKRLYDQKGRLPSSNSPYDRLLIKMEGGALRTAAGNGHLHKVGVAS